ncbi:MAG: zinc-ribbon domain-containing protein [Thermoplasmata archaeon]|nr:MAG: zinc-ribbon domain-containing protein [Thermoplasmata archaeon]
MTILDLICVIIILLIIIGVIVIAVRFLFPGPEKHYPPPQSYQQPYQYTDREYPERSYPPSQRTQRQYPPPTRTQDVPKKQESKTQITYCKGCGKQIPSDARLCPYCGKGIDSGSSRF